MKIAVILGTRPEAIRLSIILKKLRESFNTILIHTGQNYDERLNDIFFKELDIKAPEYALGIKTGNFGEQVGDILTKVEEILIKEKVDKVLILGDTNSALSAIIAEKLKIPVFHMEAGNRCHDRNVPEEINRKLVDSISSYNLPYTQLSKENLINDGIPKERIFVTGNPIYEVIECNKESIYKSDILSKLKLKSQEYLLATFHRAENVDNVVTLRHIINGLTLAGRMLEKPVICSIHPRTKQKIEEFKIEIDKKILKFHEPFGFFDFIKLETNCLAVISDSGTVSEDACILRVPNIIIRNATERLEVIECGASILSGTGEDDIYNAIKFMLGKNTNWEVPEGYLYSDVSDRVGAILRGQFKWVSK